jgi:hypothetical protein
VQAAPLRRLDPIQRRACACCVCARRVHAHRALRHHLPPTAHPSTPRPLPASAHGFTPIVIYVQHNAAALREQPRRVGRHQRELLPCPRPAHRPMARALNISPRCALPGGPPPLMPHALPQPLRHRDPAATRRSSPPLKPPPPTDGIGAATWPSRLAPPPHRPRPQHRQHPQPLSTAATAFPLRRL